MQNRCHSVRHIHEQLPQQGKSLATQGV